MKRIVNSISLLLLTLCCYGAAFAQVDVPVDWTALFPEIPGCEQVIKPLTRNSEVFEQTVVYKLRGHIDDADSNYGNCGTITLRSAPNTRKEALESSSGVNYRLRSRIIVQGYDAFRSSPLCGNDDSIGSRSVYFDDDKMLTASANRWGSSILEFAEKADYTLMKKSMNLLIKATEQKGKETHKKT